MDDDSRIFLERLENKIDRQFEKYDKVSDKVIELSTKIGILWILYGVVGVGVITDIIIRMIK